MRGIGLLVAVVSAVMLFTPYYYLAPVPAIGLLALLWLYKNPAIGFYVIVFLIPFASFRKIGPVNIPWAISIPVFIFFALMFMRDKRFPEETRSNLWPIIGLYLVVALLSTMFSEYPDRAWENMGLIVAAFSFVFMGMASLSPKSYQIYIPRIVIWSMGLSAGMAFFDQILGWSLFSEFHLSGSLTRSTGGSLDPNNFSIMILFVLPLVIHRAIYATSNSERIAMLVLLPMFLVTITTTFSRSGFLATIITLSLLLYHYRKFIRPKHLGFFLLFGFVGVTGFISSTSDTFWERQLSLISWEDGSLTRRASYLTVGKEAILRRPLIGSGPSTFRNIYGESEVSRQFAHRHADRFRQAHNTYLEILVGTGLLGFILFLALNIKALLNFRVAEREFENQGKHELSNLAASQRIGYMALLIFLVTLSEPYHKFMLLSLALSHGAMYFALRDRLAKEDDITDFKRVNNAV